MARDIELILDDILEMIAVVEKAVSEKARSDFDADFLLRLAIQRAIEIISEASKHIPTELLDGAPKFHGDRSGGWETFCVTNIIASPMT